MELQKAECSIGQTNFIESLFCFTPESVHSLNMQSQRNIFSEAYKHTFPLCLQEIFFFYGTRWSSIGCSCSSQLSVDHLISAFCLLIEKAINGFILRKPFFCSKSFLQQIFLHIAGVFRNFLPQM